LLVAEAFKLDGPAGDGVDFGRLAERRSGSVD
jgi:hypothetical protein